MVRMCESEPASIGYGRKVRPIALRETIGRHRDQPGWALVHTVQYCAIGWRGPVTEPNACNAAAF
jgi:hypothetical protein